MNSEELVKSVLKSMQTFNIDDVPNIDLYMDQVLTYLNNKFVTSKRYEEDKLLTKTMINNYTKNRLLPPPEKKKYSEDHVIILAMIFFFKNVISINDVTTILSPLIENHFHDEDKSIREIVNSFLEYTRNNDFLGPILQECKSCSEMLKDKNFDDREYLETLGLIAILSYDMFIRKRLIENLIDSIPVNDTEKNEKDKKKQKDKETD